MSSSTITNTTATDGIQANIGAPIKYLETDRENTLKNVTTRGPILHSCFNPVVVDPSNTANGTFAAIDVSFARRGCVVFAGTAVSANATPPNTNLLLQDLLKDYHLNRSLNTTTDIGVYPWNFLYMCKPWMTILFYNSTAGSITIQTPADWTVQGTASIPAGTYAFFNLCLQRSRTQALTTQWRLVRIGA